MKSWQIKSATDELAIDDSAKKRCSYKLGKTFKKVVSILLNVTFVYLFINLSLCGIRFFCINFAREIDLEKINKLTEADGEKSSGLAKIVMATALGVTTLVSVHQVDIFHADDARLASMERAIQANTHGIIQMGETIKDFSEAVSSSVREVSHTMNDAVTKETQAVSGVQRALVENGGDMKTVTERLTGVVTENTKAIKAVSAVAETTIAAIDKASGAVGKFDRTLESNTQAVSNVVGNVNSLNKTLEHNQEINNALARNSLYRQSQSSWGVLQDAFSGSDEAAIEYNLIAKDRLTTPPARKQSELH